MENASKALLIAAGMILAVLIISLLVVFYNQVSSFYEGQSKLTEIEQIEKFNAKFENYHDKQIRGNELISILNRIIDYNNLQSDMEGYERIVVKVDLKGRVNEDLSYDKDAKIITDPIQNVDDDENIKNLAHAALDIVTSAKYNILHITEQKLQKMCLHIDQIVINNPTDEDKEDREQLLNGILGYTVDNSDIGDIINAIKNYHELSQLKRVMFRCTEVTYDVETGRVNGMEFEALLNDNGTLKMK